MTTLRKVLPFTLLCAALSGLPLAAQNQDISFTKTFTGDDATWIGVSNLSGNTPSVNWRVTFSTTGTLTTQVTFQGSPDRVTWTAVPNTICSATVQPPCIFQGSNPTAADAQGMIYASLYANYVRVITSGSAGAGTATVRGYGVKGASAASVPPGGGGSGNLIFVTVNPVGACTVGTDVNEQSTVTGAQFTCVGPPGLNNGTWALIIAANSAPLNYYYTNTASDIATYLQATIPTFSPKTTITFTTIATGTHTIKNWATILGQPNLTTFAAGAYTQHVHALRVSGGAVTLHTEFWEVSSVGVDIAKIGTTEDTPALTTSELEYNLVFADNNTYSLASVNSRIVGRLVAVVTGSASTFRVFVGGTADTHMTLPGNVAGNSPVLDPGSIDCPDATGSTTVYTCPTPSPIPTGYATGQLIAFKPQTTNTTTGPTLNVATLGPLNLVAATGGAASLTVGQLVGGTTYLFEYDGTVLRLQGSSGGGSGTVTHTGSLTSNAVILGNGTADVKPGAVLPADATKFYDGTGNFSAPPAASAVPAASNLIPVTVSANTTADQTLQEISLPAGILNTVNAANLIHGSGYFTIAAAQTPALTFKARLCTVAGCGAGTVLTLATITTDASIAATNNGWNMQLMVATVSNGSSGTLSVHGAPGLTVDIGALTSSAASLYVDTNTTATAGIDLSAALFVDFTVATSAGNAGNAFTQNIAESLPWIGTGGGMGFLHSRSLTINHTKCGSSDSTNFPVLVSLSNTTFKTVANGGHVQNSNGYDIIFAADSAGVTKYPWEIEFYDGTNGLLVAWVQVPTVSHTADTVFYVLYDDATITSPQNTGSFAPTNVWDSNYVGVWHLPNGTTLTANDSTANALNGTLTNTPTATAGQIDGAGSFVAASSQYISLGSHAALNLTGAFTIEAWIHPTATNGRILSNLVGGFDGYDIYMNGGTVELQIGNGGLHQVGAPNFTLGTTHHYVGTFNGTTTGTPYLDGAVGTADSGFSGLGAGSNAYIGRFGVSAAGFWDGWLDEVRLSNIARTADWITTEYNNQFGPGNIGSPNFITYGAEI